jgi:hypothetical protein
MFLKKILEICFGKFSGKNTRNFFGKRVTKLFSRKKVPEFFCQKIRAEVFLKIYFRILRKNSQNLFWKVLWKKYSNFFGISFDRLGFCHIGPQFGNQLQTNYKKCMKITFVTLWVARAL